MGNFDDLVVDMDNFCAAYLINADNYNNATIHYLLVDEIIDTAVKILIKNGYSVKKEETGNEDN